VPDSLDPIDGATDLLLHAPLAQVSPTGAITPVLASVIDIHADGSQAAITLPPDLRSAHGCPLNGPDVAYTFAQAQASGVLASPVTVTLHTSLTLTIDAGDASDVRPLLQIGIVPETYHLGMKSDADAYDRQPVSTGPYALLAWLPDRLVLDANPLAPVLPTMPRIEWLLLPPDEAVHAARSGELDIAAVPDDAGGLPAHMHTLVVATQRYWIDRCLTVGGLRQHPQPLVLETWSWSCAPGSDQRAAREEPS
jgi:peptide/nickel transport system substrate-binding protein